MRAVCLLLMAIAMPAGADAPSGPAPPGAEDTIAACAAAEDAEPERAIALADSLLAGPALAPVQRADALGCRGWARATLSRTEPARDDAYALTKLIASLGATPERVRLTRRAGGILHRAGDRVGAVDLYARAAADAEAQGLEAERIPLLVNLGVLHSEFEEHERAQVNYEQALLLMDRLGDHRYEAPVRFNLGLNFTGQQRHAEAVPHLRRALELVRDSGFGGPMQELTIAIALAGALLETGEPAEAEALLAQVRAADAPLREGALALQLRLLDARQRDLAGDAAGALEVLDGIDPEALTEIQHWQMLRQRAGLLERLGRYADATGTLRRINELREGYLRHQNHQRLAALDAHMRDREQRHELERLQADSALQARQLAAQQRLQWTTAAGAILLLLLGAAIVVGQRRMNRRLLHASRTDPLTGLDNRRAMTGHLRTLARDGRAAGALLLIDIDLFKSINDRHGHDVGDQVLMVFARRLRERLGSDASVARWGGEEFLLVAPGVDATSVHRLAEDLRNLLAEPIATARGTVRAGVSIGYANLPLPGAEGVEAWHPSLQLADSALYFAKHSGRDAWAGYWIDRRIPDWPPERLGREPERARSEGVIAAMLSRPPNAPLRPAPAP